MLSIRTIGLLAILPAFVAVTPTIADDETVVFRSDVALARVDAQVVDSHNRTITGLRAEDFVLLEDGKAQAVKNFASENMPIDILLLLDVSASMRPHVQRISDAAHDALRVLADNDRVAIMVFDTYTRVRLPFRANRSEINRGLSDVLNQERFNGGTHITHALLAAADYVRREARPEARRAVVILTDDGSQDVRDDANVGRALSRADAVLSYLECPDAMPQRRAGGGYPGRVGTGWPGTGGPIILGGGSRRRYPAGAGQIGNHSAGTAAIARDSGGDVFPVDDSAALEDTLMRLRQRYALHFNSTDANRGVHLDLTNAARQHYPDAELHYRRVSISGTNREAGPVSITRAHTPDGGPVKTAASDPPPATGIDELLTPKRRRVGVDQGYGAGPDVNADPNRSGPDPRE